MANLFGQYKNRQIIPPNLVAFLAGVLLALVVGMIFRKMIDKIEPSRKQTALRAQASAVPADKTPSASESANKSTSQPESNTAEKSLPDNNKSSIVEANSTSPTANTNNAQPKDVTSTAKSETTSPVTESAKVEDTETEQSPNGEVDYLAWRRLLRSVEEMATRQGIKVSAVTLTPRYKHWAKGLAITRGQFLDVVSRKVPANLPTRQSRQGLILHALSTADFDTAQLTKIVNDTGTRLEPLCRTSGESINIEGVERITVITSNTPNFFRCLQDWLNKSPNISKVLELSLVSFTRGPTFFGSMTSEKKLISLQMWNPDWLVDNTVAMDETGREPLIQKRTLRLANVTRALGQPSDVRLQIPASTRSLTGPLVEPKDPSPAKPLVIGNFALVPSHMPRGTLIATAYTSPGQDRSKSASVQPPGPGRARALVLATQGKKLQFMTVTRE